MKISRHMVPLEHQERVERIYRKTITSSMQTFGTFTYRFDDDTSLQESHDGTGIVSSRWLPE